MHLCSGFMRKEMAAKCKVIVFELMVFQTSQSWLILLPNLDIWKLKWGSYPFLACLQGQIILKLMFTLSNDFGDERAIIVTIA